MADIGFGPSRIDTGRDKIEKARSPYKKPDKDFRKVLAREPEDERRQGEENTIARDSKEEKTKRPLPKKTQSESKETALSLFDLPKSSRKEELKKGQEALDKEPGAGRLDEDLQESSLSALLSGMKGDKLRKSDSSGMIASGPKTDKVHPQFGLEQPDLSYVNPKTQGTAPVTQTNAGASAAHAVEMAEIAEQLIEKLYMVENKGDTDTTIQLRHPPLFEGVKLTMTSFDTAKGEFNLKFHGLTQQAKEVLDLQDNQNALRMALDQKGYVIHIVSTSTYDEPEIAFETEPGARGEEERGQEQQKEQKEE